MAETFNGLIPAEEWLNVGFEVTRPNDPFDRLIGDIRTNNIVAKWRSIAAEYQRPIMAQFHAFDVEANKTVRIPVDERSIKKGLIKVKINQSELLRDYAEHGVRDDQMMDYVLNDGIRLADQVFTRSKVAKAEMLATGKVTIKENNLDIPVDYGVPEEQTSLTIDLSPDADISGQIQAIIDQAAEIGITLTGMITARKNITKMRRNVNLQKEINSSLGAGATLTKNALSAYLESEYGISDIITNDLFYGADVKEGIDMRPVVSKNRYYPDDRITFFATNPAGKVGVGLWGDPPEANIGGFYPTGTSSVSPFVYITQNMTWDPAELWTKASGLFMPLLYDPNSLWIATIKEETSSDGSDEEDTPSSGTGGGSGSQT